MSAEEEEALHSPLLLPPELDEDDDCGLAAEAAAAAARPLPRLLQLRALLFEEEDELAQYTRVALFQCLILVGYGSARAAASAGLPEDAKDATDGALVAADLAELAGYGATGKVGPSAALTRPARPGRRLADGRAHGTALRLAQPPPTPPPPVLLHSLFLWRVRCHSGPARQPS